MGKLINGLSTKQNNVGKICYLSAKQQVTVPYSPAILFHQAYLLDDRYGRNGRYVMTSSILLYIAASILVS